MRHLLFSILILILFLSTSSCKKKDLNFIVKGNVSAMNIGGNLANVEIKVYTSSLGSSYEVLNSQTTTDASGNYELEIIRDRFEMVIFKLSKANYFTTRKTYSFEYFTTAEDNKLNYKLSPQSWLRFQIESSAANTIKIQKVSGKTDCNDCCENGVIYEGPANTAKTCPNDGGSYVEFHYWINNNEFYKHDSVFTTPFDTTTYLISY